VNAQLKSIDFAPDASQTLCFHCNEPVPAGTHIHALIRNQSRAMCCEGCRAVAELISAVGLQDYYQYRDEPALKPAGDQDEFVIYSQPDVAEQYVRNDGDNHVTTLLVDGIRCAACAWLIDRMLRRDANIKDVDVTVAASRVRVIWKGESTYLAKVMRMLANIGYRPHALDADALRQHAHQERRDMLKRLGVAGVGMMQVMMYVLPTYIHSDMDATVRHYLQLTGLLLTTPVLFYAGGPFLQSAVRVLRQHSINMDVPVSIALVLAYGASVINTLRGQGETYFDSVSMFVFFLTLARFVVMSVRHHNQSIADALVRMQPRIAHRIVDHVITDVPVKQLVINDVVQVRAGETIPADGVIINGQSSVDESLLTGESLPVSRQTGDAVLAGSVNVANVVEIRVSQLGQHTVMSGILALLEQMQTCKPRSITVADTISRWFLQALLLAAAIVGIVWYIIDPSRAFNIVLAVLVVTCPCALSLAAPAVLAATTTALARRGLLITRPDVIEQLATVQTMAFDKTGTLTTGKITIAGITTFGTVKRDDCLCIAASLEQAVDHPIARAFDASCRERIMTKDLRVVAGAGVEGRIDTMRYRLGRYDFAAELARENASEDRVHIWLGSDQGIVARFELSDTLRTDAKAAIQDLQRLQVRSVLISGDSEQAVQSIAAQSGIDECHARQLPADKVHILQQLEKDTVTAMIGDGINDAPVLGAASISIAMGGGTSVAQATADAVLMNNSLTVLPLTIRIARRAKRVMQQNLWWAALYNLAAIPLAAMGQLSPWIAAAGMSASSIFVVLNATRVLRVKSA